MAYIYIYMYVYFGIAKKESKRENWEKEKWKKKIAMEEQKHFYFTCVHHHSFIGRGKNDIYAAVRLRVVFIYKGDKKSHDKSDS